MEKYKELKRLKFPIFDSEEVRTKHINEMIEVGAIPVKDLKIGKFYKGICRNANEAVWDGEKFTYIRFKFGITYPEEINHFENELGPWDVFIPYEEINEE